MIVCFAGIFGLFVQLIAQSFFGAEVGAGLTGTFGTLATLPVVDSAVEKFSTKRGPANPGDPPSPPPPTSQDPAAPRPPDEQPHDSSGVRFSVVVA